MMSKITELKAKWLGLEPTTRMIVIVGLLGVPAYFLADVLMPKAPAEAPSEVRERQKPVFMSSSGSQRLEATQTIGQLEAMKKDIKEREKAIDAKYSEQEGAAKRQQDQIDKLQMQFAKSNQVTADLQRQLATVTDKLMRYEAGDGNLPGKGQTTAANGKKSDTFNLDPMSQIPNEDLTNMPSLPQKPLVMDRGNVHLAYVSKESPAAGTSDGKKPSAANNQKVAQAKAAISKGPVPANKAPTKEPETWVSAGTVIPVTLLTGHHVPTTSDAKNDPLPVLMKIVDVAEMPNGFTIDLRGCTVIGAARGSASTRRVDIRAESISCIDTGGRAIEQPLLAAAQGPDGQGGIPAKLVTLYGETVKQSFWAGIYGTGAQTLANAANNRSSSNGSAIYSGEYLSSIGNTAVAGGVSKSFDRISEFYLNLAEEARPYLEMPGGVEGVDLIVQRGMSIKYKG